MRPEERVDTLTNKWVTNRSRERMCKSLKDPSLGTNVPKPNLFEQWRASGSPMTFGEWAKKQGAET